MLLQKSYIDSHGKLAIPIKIRKILHLSPGDEVIIDCIDNKLVVTTFREKLAHARSIVKQYVKISLTDELKKLRAEDAAKE
jgi:bifunctional DNA-binding transcriptional regulator/antitoxin component of YhaV-PrlF toxin-antitoxin module